MDAENGYLLANQQAQAGTRFEALASLFDPSTFRHLREIGVGSGWRCWEVGAGGVSVPQWLAAQVGPTGLVLTHVPQRGAALTSMIAALRPGGRLLVEEADPGLQPLLCPDDHGPAQHLANRLRHGFRTLMAERAADLAYGRTLPRLLRDHGLVDVAADAYFPITAPACATLERATVEQIRDRLISAGIATAAEIDQHLDNIATGRVPDLATSPMISAWGRKPG